ncbi:MAG: YraN family protein, partial [Pseudomonadota bacterium]
MADRQAAERRGRRGETLAALALQLKGYAILARRVRTPSGEIDLIARRGNLVAFVEVKARPDLMAALEAVTPRAQARICRTAELWMARRTELAGCD